MLYSGRAVASNLAVLAALLAVGGCSQSASGLGESLTSVKSMVMPTNVFAYGASAKERECLARAMFFESNRSSRDGLVAVGSVVMNRKDSGQWGDSICDVVGAKKQFAPGVLTRPMNSKALPDVMAAADAVLDGERHPKVGKDVMFFHTAGLKFPYKNMNYTTVAGGNAFYFKRSRKQDRLPQPVFEETQIAVAEVSPPPAAKPASGGGWFGKLRKSRPAEDVQMVAKADPAPAPTRAARPAPEATEVAFAEEPPVPTLAPRAAKSAPAAAVSRPVAVAETYVEPSADRFGGPAEGYVDAGSGLTYGNGGGVLGQLSLRN